jgi:hypothetical protein
VLEPDASATGGAVWPRALAEAAGTLHAVGRSLQLSAVVTVAALVTAAAAGAAAVPELALELPPSARQGETVTVRGTLANAGDADAGRIFLDVVVPEAGPDGDPATDDGLDLGSVAFLETLTRGQEVRLDASGRGSHPFLVAAGEPEPVQGEPGGLLWVAVDGFRETLLAGESVGFELAVRMGAAAPAGGMQTIRVRAGFARADVGDAGSGAALTPFRDFAIAPRAVTLAEVAEQLAGDPVVVVAAAELALSESDERALEATLRSAREPLALVVVPEAIGTPQDVLAAVVPAAETGTTVVAVVGERYVVAPDGEGLQAVLDSALAEYGPSAVDEVLRAFALGLGRPPADPAPSPAPPEPAAGVPAEPPPGGIAPEDADGAPVLAIVLSVLGAPAVVAFGAFALTRLRRRAATRPAIDDTRAHLEATVGALGDEVGELLREVEGASVPDDVRDAYTVAVERHQQAALALASASTREELAAVARATEAARADLRRARARLR